MKMKKIAVTTDFSDLAARAYSTALQIATRFDAKIYLIHTAVSLPPFYYVHAEGIPTDIPRDAHLDEIKSQLEEESRHPNFQKREVEPHLIYHGFPQEALATFARQNDIDLIVCSTHGRTGFGHFVLGSYAEKLVRLSTTPVLVDRGNAGGATDGYKKILVPFDFSKEAESVFPMVQFLSGAYDAHFTFVYVLEPIPYTIASHSSPALAAIRDAAFAAPDVAKRRFETLKKEQFPKAKVEMVTLEGTPVTEIVNLAKTEEVDLVLVSTHGRTGFQHLVLGSVAENVVRRAPCAVMTVRPSAETEA